MKHNMKLIAAAAIIALFLSSCQMNPMLLSKIKTIQNIESKEQEQIQQENEQLKVIPKDIPEEKTIDLAKIHPNENGKIMVLMYHDIGEKESEWTRTPDNFRKDLETLYAKGYRPIRLKDYVENNITVPAGKTPFVLTFDDGTKGQFNTSIKDGNLVVDPNCAVGIMEEMNKKYSDYHLTATFFVYYPIPFRQKNSIHEKFSFLVKNGYDIGNHTYSHQNLYKMDAEEIQQTLAQNVKSTLSYLPNYTVVSLALPYGGKPERGLYQFVVSGEYDKVSYHNKAVLLVGANPGWSPNNKKFDSSQIPRVRASEINTGNVGLYDWLASLDKHPEQRYVSDGDPATITVPEAEKDNISKVNMKNKKLRLYP